MTNPNTGKVPLTVYVDPPPEGMAWKQDARFATGDEVLMVGLRSRPIVPATVMVEIRGELAERVRATKLITLPSDDELELRGAIMMGLANARAALARKPELLCGKLFADCTCVYGTSCEHDRNCTRPLGHEGPHADRKPCPVMVCALYGGKSKDCWRKDTHEQRPCKLSEGHGGAHE